MVRPLVAAQVQSAIDALVSSGRLPRVEYPAVEIQDTKQPEHGDLATNWAMVAFKMVSGAPSSSAGMHVPEDEEGVGGGHWASDAERDLYKGDTNLRDRCQAALKKSRECLEVLIFQLVRFVKDGKPAPMRKRDGNIYALIDLINEIGEKVKPNGTAQEKQNAGKDVARFFYLMRHHDTTFDFDLDLAARQSDENPVFYVQYAHARVCSVLEKARAAGYNASTAGGRQLAIHPKERALVLKIADLPYEVQRCAEDYAVSRLTTYSVELARTYHGFYDSCRVINAEDEATRGWRLELCEATRSALKAAFDLLGISAPERMDRDTVEPED